MSTKRLEELGIVLPRFPITSVGSFPKPDQLKKARADYAQRRISQEKLEQEEETATRFWVEWQDEAGVDVLVDGEMYRGDMVTFFAETMRGFEIGGLVRSYGNTYYHKPIIVGEVEWVQPITTEWFKYAQSLTKKPVKGMLSGPYTVMDWCFLEHYDSRRDATLSIAKQIRKEVEALVEAGCRIIQIDEPAIPVRPDEVPLAIEAMQVVTEGIDAYFITHICRDGFESIYPDVMQLPVDNIDLELSDTEDDLLPLLLENPTDKDISFGLVDVHSKEIESEEQVLGRIGRAIESFPAERLWFDPDCGLKNRSIEEAKRKLEVIVSCVNRARESSD
jgi:5-methyltetrahydropteroyltriglutamate--homocysteine methyltransferase